MSNYYHLKVTVWANRVESEVFTRALPRLFANSKASSVLLGQDGQWEIYAMEFNTTEGSASALCSMVSRGLAAHGVLAQVQVDVWDAEVPYQEHHTTGYHTYAAAVRRACAVERERVLAELDTDTDTDT